MKLPVYSSKPRGSEPNLIGVQDPRIEGLPTVLVCPLKRGAPSPFRPVIRWEGQDFTVLCDLIRPIHRGVLRFIGTASEEESARAIHSIIRLLGRD